LLQFFNGQSQVISAALIKDSYSGKVLPAFGSGRAKRGAYDRGSLPLQENAISVSLVLVISG
jgi:hypothetical protein